jgi:hypothetical protein
VRDGRGDACVGGEEMRRAAWHRMERGAGLRSRASQADARVASWSELEEPSIAGGCARRGLERAMGKRESIEADVWVRRVQITG